ncbi:hypothetical protein Gotur_019545, partial [Gossypium turneri]
MDRGNKPLEKVGEWTTVHKRLNKGKTINPNQGFVTLPAQISFYPNQGYYILYPMVRQPVGTHLSFTLKMVSQFPWSQDPNSGYQANYAEIIKGVENLLKTQQIQEIKYFYNPGLPLELYNFINEFLNKELILEELSLSFHNFKVKKTTKENEAHDLLLKSILYRDWEELEIGYLDIKEI